MEKNNFFNIWKINRFWSIFLVQFLGAFNDNVFKNALVILITYKSFKIGVLTSEQIVALAGGIFILPFFIFSAVAGQMADKYSKSLLVGWVKFSEIIIMGIGAYGFISENFILLLLTLFLMGLQSSFFGPVKYSVLPELLQKNDLITGNAFFEFGTFIAILIGTILGGVLIGIDNGGEIYVSIAVIILAILGFIISLKMVPLKPVVPKLKIPINIFSPTLEILKITKKQRRVYLAILGISWFWFLGAALLSILPSLCKDYLSGNEGVVTFCLALFSVGVAIGSIFCERLSFHQLEIGLVPIGSIGITIFTFDLFLALNMVPAFITSQSDLSVWNLLTNFASIRIFLDLFLFAVLSGFFIVPLYTMIQEEGEKKYLSRIVAGNNILNAIFMVVSAVLLMIFFALGLTLPYIFLIYSLLNLVVAMYIYKLIPEFMYRFLCWFCSYFFYNLKVYNKENIRRKGPAILICNNISFIDWMFIASTTQNPIRFVIPHYFFNFFLLKKIIAKGQMIPTIDIDGKNEVEENKILEKSKELIAKELKKNNIVCLFPEAKISTSEKLNPIRPYVIEILNESKVPIIPLHLSGLKTSLWSKKSFGLINLVKSISNFRNKITLKIGPELTEQTITIDLITDTFKKLSK